MRPCLKQTNNNKGDRLREGVQDKEEEKQPMVKKKKAFGICCEDHSWYIVEIISGVRRQNSLKNINYC